MKKRSIPQKIINKMIKDRKVRTGITTESHWYFFHFYFAHYVKYPIAPFHEEIFQITEDEKIKLAVIVAFRGSAKSTLISTSYVLWSILGKQQKKFVVLCGQTEQKARQYLLNIKNELLHNELLRKDLGPFEEERNNLGNATALIIKRLKVKIMISSVEQSIRGMRYSENRPDLIILDDVEDINSVKTRAGRNKVFDWLTGEIIPAGSEKTRIIAVGNLLHEDSLLKRLQKRIEGGEMKYMNGVYREYPIIDDQSNPLWLGKYPNQESIELEQEKTMNDIAWHREYLLKIISSDEQIVKNEWIHFYKELPFDLNVKQIFIGVDLAISEENTADYTAMVVGYIYGYGKNMKIYIQPKPINERIPFPVQLERLKAMYATYAPKCFHFKVFVEDVGYQRALTQMLDHYMTTKIESVSVGRNDKATRLQFTTSLLKEGRILFPENGCEELIEQLLGFGKETHDDLVDAFSIMIIKALEKNVNGPMSGIGRPDAI